MKKPKHGDPQLGFTVQMVRPDSSTGCGHAYLYIMQLEWHDKIEEIRQNVYRETAAAQYAKEAAHLERSTGSTMYLYKGFRERDFTILWQDDERRRHNWYAPKVEGYFHGLPTMMKVLKAIGIEHEDSTPQDVIEAITTKLKAIPVQYDQVLSYSSYVPIQDWKLADSLPPPVWHYRCPVKDTYDQAACGQESSNHKPAAEVTCPKCQAIIVAEDAAGKAVA